MTATGAGGPIEVDPHDRVLLERIGRLRVRAWATFDPTVLDRGECWLDDFELSARHWVIFSHGEPIAASRLSIHKQLGDVPDCEIYDGVFAILPPGPVASFNRLVVHPDYRGRGFSRAFDDIRMAAAIEFGCRSVIGETHSGASRIAQLNALGFRVVGPARPYPPGHFAHRSGVVIYRDLKHGGAGGIRETTNRMGWSSDVINEISKEFVDYAAACAHPVLDIGAAYGLATIPSLEAGATVFANDMSPYHLDELRARTSPKLLRHLKTIPGRFPCDLKFANESFDAIHVSQVLHFLTPEEVTMGLQYAFDWLRPGGRLFVLVATPYQATHAGFAPVFLQRKARGEDWPGIIENLRVYNTHWSANHIPSWLHVFDDEVLSAVVQRTGFLIESVRMFSRAGLPDFCLLDGRENLGLVASKPIRTG